VNAYAGLDPMDKPGGFQSAAKKAAEAVEEITPRRFVVSSSPWFYYYAGIDPFDDGASANATYEDVITAPVGSMIVYEPFYAGNESYGDLDSRKLLDSSAFRPVFRDDEWQTMVFEKTREISSPNKDMFSIEREGGY